MFVEENLKVNRVWYALTKGVLKKLPMIMAGLYWLNTVLSYFDIDVYVFSIITGIGILPWLFIMLSSYMFRFCLYHRMFLWYIIVNDTISWIDYKWHIPISDWNYLILHNIAAGVFLFLVLYFRIKCK